MLIVFSVYNRYETDKDYPKKYESYETENPESYNNETNEEILNMLSPTIAPVDNPEES